MKKSEYVCLANTEFSKYEAAKVFGRANCPILVHLYVGFTQRHIMKAVYIYRVIHKSLRDFRTRLRNNQDRHGNR